MSLAARGSRCAPTRSTCCAMHNFRRLLVWQKAHALTLEVDRLTERIPRRGNADLISQTRRAAISIPTNIVLGSERPTDRDFARCLQISLASAAELDYHLQLAADTGKIPRAASARSQADLADISRMLVGLIRRLRAQPK